MTFLMVNKNSQLPAIVWLKCTDYLHGWLQYELGCAHYVGEQKVVCVQHLPGAREVLRMETWEDMMEPMKVGNVMSATRRNCIAAGLKLDPDVIERQYGMTKETMSLFVPIECPKMCLTKNGVLRPWTNDVCFGQKQAKAMAKLLFREFWKAVAEFDREYAKKMNGEKYAAKDMVEEFCEKTNTYSYHVDTIRREWMRQRVRMAS